MAMNGKYGEVSVENDSDEHPLNGSDEPVFVLRASDNNAVSLLQVYAEMCQTGGSPQAHLDGITESLGRFVDWQTEHEDAVKVAD